MAKTGDGWAPQASRDLLIDLFIFYQEPGNPLNHSVKGARTGGWLGNVTVSPVRPPASAVPSSSNRLGSNSSRQRLVGRCADRTDHRVDHHHHRGHRLHLRAHVH